MRPMNAKEQFGHFLRQHRKALGLSLREYCRRNGFDAPFVSKLERGLLPPPRSSKTLEAYAKALSLPEDSLEWERFSDLAQKAASPERLPGVRSASHMAWGTHLVQWADGLNPRGTLPQLVRRLVHATVEPSCLTSIHFPAQEGIQAPGWDGIVVATQGNAFVPEGLSTWELSVAKDQKKKAEEDFKKRTAEPRVVEPSQATFVFVTPRRWPKKDEWCAEKRKQKKWKDVRAYDADTLDDWLEQASGVSRWLANLLGARPEGADDIHAYWEACKESTVPPLSAKVFLASREQNIEQFAAWYKSAPSVLAMESPSPNEVLDFVAACYACVCAGNTDYASLQDIYPDDMAARTLYVSDLSAWRSLASSTSRLVLIATPGLSLDQEAITTAARRGHHVLLASNRFLSNRSEVKPLIRPRRHDLEGALKASGMTEEEASQYSRQSGGSLTALKRLVARSPDTQGPPWSCSEVGTRLVPFILLGSWDENCEADKEAVERLSKKAYSENAQIVARWLNEPDSPFLKTRSCWSLVSREDTWRLIMPFVTNEHINAFRGIAVELLTETDARLGPLAEGHSYASIYSEAFSYSTQIRSSVCETIALLSCRVDDSHPEALNLKRAAAYLIEEILPADATWQRWTSLSKLLPTLAEASPDSFLQAVENDLGKREAALAKLFEVADRSAAVSFENFHAGLLRALEVLAWEPQYLYRVSVILTRLSKYDLSDSRSYSPLDSLVKIFLPWCPHTTAKLSKRIGTLKKVVREDAQVAWKLLLSLTLGERLTANPNSSKPIWLDWAIDWDSTTSHGEYYDQVQACADMLTEMLGRDVDRHCDLLSAFLELPQGTRKKFLDSMERTQPTEFSIGNRQEICASLRQLVVRYKHSYLSSQDDADETSDRLEALQAKFEPDDLVEKNLFLFKDYWPSSYVRAKRIFEENSKALKEDRISAIQDIYNDTELRGIFNLAEKSTCSGVVGEIFVEAGLRGLDDMSEIFLTEIDLNNQRLTNFFVKVAGEILQHKGWEWIESLPLDTWSPRQAGIFLSLFPPAPQFWLQAASLGNDAEKMYWSRVYMCDKNEFFETTDEAMNTIVRKLVEYDRSLDAVREVYMAVVSETSNPSQGIITLALDSLSDELVEAINSIKSYSDARRIKNLLQYLQKQDSVDTDTLERLEFRFLELLVRYQDADPVALKRKLQREPHYFHELIEMAHRLGPENSERDLSEEYDPQANAAFSLLSTWDLIPGADESGNIDERKLLDWVRRARSLCRKAGCLDICDNRIGQMLAKELEQKGGDNASWPSAPIRSVIDEVDSKQLTEGFRTGIINKRGVIFRSWSEGGSQERALAKKYHAYAQHCDDDWPVTAEALRGAAKSYEGQAKLSDDISRKSPSSTENW